MFCPKCGNQVADGSAFCPSCGERLQNVNAQNTGYGAANSAKTGAEQGSAYSQTPLSSGQPSGTGSDWSKICLIVLAGLYALGTVLGLLGSLGAFIGLFTAYHKIAAFFSLVMMVLTTVCRGILAYMIFLLAMTDKRERKAEILYIGIIAAAILRIVIGVFDFLLSIIKTQGSAIEYLLPTCLLQIVVSLAVAGGIFVIIQNAARRRPLLDRTTDELKAMAGELIQAVTEESRRIFSSIKKSAPPFSQPAPVPQAGVNAAFAPVKTDRSLLMYILLNIITCGIYSWFFIHSMSRDINIVCREDGQKTAGLLTYILLCLVTCGIYSWIWSYGFANRLYTNAPRYGLMFSESGTTVLMWNIFGILLCCIGPFIALHIMIKNMNILAGAYNNRMSGAQTM